MDKTEYAIVNLGDNTRRAIGGGPFTKEEADSLCARFNKMSTKASGTVFHVVQFGDPETTRMACDAAELLNTLMDAFDNS